MHVKNKDVTAKIAIGYKEQTQKLSWIDGTHPRQSNQSN